MADIRELIQPPRGRRLKSIQEPVRWRWRVAGEPVWMKNRRRGRVTTAELRFVLLLGAGIGLVAATAVDKPAPLFRPVASAPAMPLTVRVVDGDTFWYGPDKIRIADIDTPEVRGQCFEETQLAARATQRLDALLAAGPFELHAAGRDTDRYGRKLRVVTRGGRSIGDMLVAEGLARTWSGRREPWCA